MKKPSHLNPKAARKYEELYRIVEPILKPGDENLLAVLANAYVTYEDANQVVTDRGVILAGETMTRQNPAVNIVKDITKTIESISADFGLSPKSRGSDLTIVKKRLDAIDKLMV